MLQAVDERLSIWGWETGTGTKFAIVVDMWGKDGRPGTGLGVKGEDVKPVNHLYAPWIRIGRADWRTGNRRSKHCKRRTYDYYKTPSTHLTTIRQWLRRAVEGKEERLRARSLLTRSRGSGIRGGWGWRKSEISTGLPLSTTLAKTAHGLRYIPP